MKKLSIFMLAVLVTGLLAGCGTGKAAEKAGASKMEQKVSEDKSSKIEKDVAMTVDQIKETSEDMTEAAMMKAEDIKEDTVKTMQEAGKALKETGKDIKEKAVETKDKAAAKTESMKKAADKKIDKAREKTADGLDTLKDKIEPKKAK